MAKSSFCSVFKLCFFLTLVFIGLSAKLVLIPGNGCGVSVPMRKTKPGGL